jgi:hypothetical protein
MSFCKNVASMRLDNGWSGIGGIVSSPVPAPELAPALVPVPARTSGCAFGAELSVEASMGEAGGKAAAAVAAPGGGRADVYAPIVVDMARLITEPNSDVMNAMGVPEIPIRNPPNMGFIWAILADLLGTICLSAKFTRQNLPNTAAPTNYRNFSTRNPPTIPAAIALVTKVRRRSMKSRTASPK